MLVNGDRRVPGLQIHKSRTLDAPRDIDLPPPLVNAALHGYTVAFLWAEQRLVVETDGRNHLRATRFESDRERDAVLQTLGYRVVRFTWRQLTERPDYVVRTLTTLL